MYVLKDDSYNLIYILFCVYFENQIKKGWIVETEEIDYYKGNFLYAVLLGKQFFKYKLRIMTSMDNWSYQYDQQTKENR